LPRSPKNLLRTELIKESSRCPILLPIIFQCPLPVRPPQVPACGRQGGGVTWGRIFAKENNISMGKVNERVQGIKGPRVQVRPI
jgi:hypothetical protein